MQAVDLVEREPLQQAVSEHGERALAPFLRRLEDEANGAVEPAFLSQDLRRTEQHRRVAVMAAGMHDARVLRAIGHVRLFGDAQGVHIGPKRDRPVAIAALQRADDARAANTFDNVIKPNSRSLRRRRCDVRFSSKPNSG